MYVCVCVCVCVTDCFTELGATPLLPLALGDDSEELIDKYNRWSERATKKIKATLAGIELKPIVNKNYYESHINPKPKDEKKASVPSATSTPPTLQPFVTVRSTIAASVTPSDTTTISTSTVSTATSTPKDPSETINEGQVVAINTKPKKAKFQKNVGKGKVSKANAFQIQQKLVREEAKAPVVSTGRTDTSIIAVIRSASSGISDNSDGICCQSNDVSTVPYVLVMHT